MLESFETCHEKGGGLSMHRHKVAYVALVLEGVYEERSVDGLFRLDQGMLIYHPPFHAHMNAFLSDQVRVLNIELEGVGAAGYRAASMSDLRSFERLMRERPNIAISTAEEIFRKHSKKTQPEPHWLKVLARALVMERDAKPIKDLACRLGVTPEHASRKFQREFGVGPSAFRREQRLRRAIAALADGATLAGAAASAGFADQSHLGRTVKAALGETPGSLRLQACKEREIQSEF